MDAVDCCRTYMLSLKLPNMQVLLLPAWTLHKWARMHLQSVRV